VVFAVKSLALDEFPQPLNQIQVGRVRRQVQQCDLQFRCQCLDRGVSLILRVVQHERDGALQSTAGDFTKQLTHRVRIDNRYVGHGNQLSCHRVPSSQDVETLPTRRSPNEQPRERPQATQERAENEMGRIDEEHMTVSSLGSVQDGLQFGIKKLPLIRYVFGNTFWEERGWLP